MPRLARRRQVEPVAPSQSIVNFARVSKSHALDASGKKTLIEPAASKKRKASSYEDDDSTKLTRRTVSFAPSSDEDEDHVPSKRACRREQPVVAPISTTPAKIVTKGKRTAKTAPKRTEKAHKPSESTVIAQSRRQGKKVQTRIDATYKKTAKDTAGSLFPQHLAELVHLHKAFLKTVVLQFAHSGSNVPLDFRALVPHVSRSWGKRQITIEDVRRCIAIQSRSSPSPFVVSDYGRGKVCIELAPDHDAAAINENRLCRQFEENLQALCAERAMDEMTDVEIPLGSLSLGDLPQVDITNMDSGLRANPELVKGQRALSELKNARVAKEEDKAAKQQAAANNPMLNPDGTKMSLLDRLRVKQLARESGPHPPSGPELQRRAALNRVVDVAATISMLSLSNPLSLPRQAFTMPVILERLKDSLRVPVSREEGAACVRLIAAEVAPEWLRIVTIGGRENVVVQRTAQPVDRVIQERVQKLMG